MRALKRFLLFLLLMLSLSCMLGAATGAPQFTEEEQAFLAEHPVIRIGIDPKFVPFEFLDEQGQHSGIAADFLDLISKRTGLSFVHDPGLGWVDAVQKARNREIDLLPAVGYTDQRAQFLTYEEPYLHFQRSIVVQKSNTSFSRFSDLFGRQVAVQKDSSHEGFLTSYPEIDQRLYDTVEEALLAVNRAEEVAFVGNEATSIYLSRKLGLTELRFIPITEGGIQNLHMAVRSDWPLLVSILQKALDSITEAEEAQILSRWIRYESKVDYSPYIRIAGSLLIILFLGFSLSSFWIVRLRMAIKEKDIAQRQAQAADQEKSRFLARISHEIRTPLNGIRGMSYLLEKTELDANQRRYVKSIGATTQTMQTIINDILEFSRLSEDRIVLERVPFSLDDVLENCISIVSYLIRQKGLDFSINEEGPIPHHFLGDPTRIAQILINLLNNAVKFTEEGSVELNISSTQQTDGECSLSFAVKDSGIGMSEEQLETIFQPFIQANETINRRFGGSGLGLSIVKGLVEKMGGRLEVTSILHKGSTFTATIPLSIDKQGSEADQKKRKAIDFERLKALLVLHDRHLEEHISVLFGEYHLTFEGVTSTKLAAKILEQDHTFDLVMVEHQLHSEDHQSFYTMLKAQGQTQTKLLVFVHEDRQAEEEVVADLILPLPVINSVILNGLLQLFGRGSAGKIGQPSQEATPPSQHYLILVVEDNPTNQIIAKELLEQAGNQVLLASNGKEGYETFLKEEERIHLILMDLHMDVMDGYESSTLIRGKNTKVPIIVTSADLMNSVRERCESIGITELIGKPYNPEELLNAVHRLAATYSPSQESLGKLNVSIGVRNVGGNKDLYAKVLTSFIQETEVLLSELESEHDRTLIAELAHKGKGSCGAVGALEAQKLCKHVQMMAENAEAKLDKQLLLALQEQLRQVINEAKQYSSQA
ncbi:MAG: transporter substrate-binding domain-containing protein [Spirochaetia bacterium]|nr:transporter substrate-binding domain-containing protein [Spirochaetia bacterium]